MELVWTKEERRELAEAAADKQELIDIDRWLFIRAHTAAAFWIDVVMSWKHRKDPL